MALVGIIVGAVVVLFLLGLLAPRLSRRLQRKGDELAEHEQVKTSFLPGWLGKLLPWTIREEEKVVDKTSEAGRETRTKL